ncbi:bactofilin family protein [Gracilimonas mengyeensis]|uniref:Protein CcmA, bactofilin family n=1 Tax=Gracilimonas mengyeensis TaxID=1302730 RepID=A0A521AB44_9BACT|nr:polymer-forming cytoskeletal protein [Gracilimonas mengyeensis]SMO32034.1 protein CcmA, bactofilin family [Gracilimonas mengyeensis]
MLNSRRSKSKSSTPNSNGGNSPAVNIISEGTQLDGDLNSQTDIRIAGTITGEAISKGKVIITGSGKVVGNITSADADIAGKIEGEVKVSNKLTLRDSAVVDGNIFTKTLIVEEGAKVNGSCKMGADIKSISRNSDADYASDTKKVQSSS